jgi:hypothetical protein
LVTSNATNSYIIGAGASSGGSSFEFRDVTNSATRAVITSSGNLLVGTTANSTAKIVSIGNGNQAGVYALAENGTVNGLYGVYGQSAVISTYASGGVFGESINNNTYGIIGYWSGSAYWTLYGNGNTYITGTYQGSDERLKENILPLSDSLSKITALRPVEFDWKANTDQAKNKAIRDCGLIAQEVLPILPGIVKEIDARQPNDGATKTLNEELGKFYTIEYSRLIPHLISAVKEQQAIIQDLTTRLELLENK